MAAAGRERKGKSGVVTTLTAMRTTVANRMVTARFAEPLRGSAHVLHALEPHEDPPKQRLFLSSSYGPEHGDPEKL